MVRFAYANSELWFDELVNLDQYVRRPFAEIVTTYRAANNHVFNSILSRIAVGLLGESPWVIRLPAIAAGIATVGVFFLLAKLVLQSRVALTATFLLAISYPHVFYCQNARGYSLFLFFALLAAVLAVRLDDPGETADRRALGTGYALAIGFGLYTIPLAVVVIAGHSCVALVGRRWRLLGWLSAGTTLGALLYAPMASALLAYYTDEPLDTGHPLLSTELLQELGPAAIVLALGSVPATALGVRLLRRTPYWTAIVFLPLAFNLTIPLLTGQGVHPRTFVYALPLAYLLLAEALAWGQGRFRRASLALVAALALASTAVLARYLPVPKQPLRAALERTRAENTAAPGNGTVIGLGVTGWSLRFHDPTVEAVETRSQLDDVIARREDPAAPVWILYSFANLLRSGNPDLYGWIEERTDPVVVLDGTIGDGDVHVRLWRGPGLASP